MFFVCPLVPVHAYPVIYFFSQHTTDNWRTKGIVMNHGLLTRTNGKPKTPFLSPVLMILSRESTSPKWPSKQQPTATVASRFFSRCHSVFHCRNSPCGLQQTWCFLILRSFVGKSESCASKFELNKLGTFCFWHANVYLSYSMCPWPATAHSFCNTQVPIFWHFWGRKWRKLSISGQGENAPMFGVQNFEIASTLVGWAEIISDVLQLLGFSLAVFIVGHFL